MEVTYQEDGTDGHVSEREEVVDDDDEISLGAKEIENENDVGLEQQQQHSTVID